MKIIIMLIINILLNSSASFLLRIGSSKINQKDDGGIIFSMLKSPLIWCGGFCFAMGFFVYTLILQKTSLTNAYPIVTSGTLILITLLSYFVLKESINLIDFVGIGLILLGMGLIVYKF